MSTGQCVAEAIKTGGAVASTMAGVAAGLIGLLAVIGAPLTAGASLAGGAAAAGLIGGASAVGVRSALGKPCAHDTQWA